MPATRLATRGGGPLATARLAAVFRRRFRQIHFVDSSMERSTADAEFFGRGRHVAIRRGERLHDQFLLRLVQIERTRLFAKSFGGGNTTRRRRFSCLSHRHWEIAQCDFWTSCHHNAVFDRGAQLADVARPVVSEKRIHRVGRKIDKRLIVCLAEVPQESADKDRNIFLSLRATAAW